MSRGIERNEASTRGANLDGSTHGPRHDALMERIATEVVRVGIIALGNVGLPLARAFCDRGIAVLGFDVAPAKFEKLRRGRATSSRSPPKPSAPCATPASSQPPTSRGLMNRRSSSSASPPR